MSQKKETLPLHEFVGATVDVEWEKEGESGRLTFHGTGKFQDKFPPLEFKVDHLKGSTVSLARITYFLNGKEKARFVEDLKEGSTVDAHMVEFYASLYLKGRSQFPSSYKQMFSHKAFMYIQKGAIRAACRLPSRTIYFGAQSRRVGNTHPRDARPKMRNNRNLRLQEERRPTDSRRQRYFHQNNGRNGPPPHSLPLALEHAGVLLPAPKRREQRFRSRRTRRGNQRYRVAIGNFRRASQGIQRPRAQNMDSPAKRVETLSRWDDLHDRAPYWN